MAETAEAVFEEIDLNFEAAHLDGLLPALKRLDRLLERAITAAERSNGPEAAIDPYRGLYINQAEVERLLAREPGTPTLQPTDEGADEPLPDPLTDSSRLTWLRDAFGLSLFEMDLILIALAPELDRRYERLYAFLQDHVSRRRPSVDLALNLLCPNAVARLERRAHFDPDAPLIRHGLLHLIPEPAQDFSSLLGHTLKLDEQIVNFLLHQDGLDARLTPFCQLVFGLDFLDELPLAREIKRALPTLVSQAWTDQQPLRLYFHGLPGAGKRQTAAAVAMEIGLPLLFVDLARAVTSTLDFSHILRLVFRYAWFQEVILYLDNLDELRMDSRVSLFQQLTNALADDAGITILAGSQPWTPSGRRPLGMISVPFPIPNFTQRRDCWQAELAAVDIALEESDLDDLAGRFRLTPTQIAEAVTIACHHAQWRTAAQPFNPAPNSQPLQSSNDAPQPYSESSLDRSLPTRADLFSAARAQSGHDLAALAHKIEPLYTWDDIVLPEDTFNQLRELCQRVTHRHRVLDEWGFDRKLSLGKGVSALFAGPSGTGKTMAAEIIANALGLDLYKIDLSGVVSKYIGETEKNLDRIFTTAENANAILFFDEADALFGKRSEVRDSHDRYANIEISYLLQKMEEYEGIAILATNLRQNMDESFVRRIAFTVHFPFPDEAGRRQIWTGIWPDEMRPLTQLDFDGLARQFKLSGGNIKNVALAAAFLAAEDGGQVTMAHLIQATRREYQKMGKTLTDADLNGYGP